MSDKVYVIVNVTKAGDTLVESVWSSKALAKAAVLYHAGSMFDVNSFKIVERTLNTTTMRGDGK